MINNSPLDKNNFQIVYQSFRRRVNDADGIFFIIFAAKLQKCFFCLFVMANSQLSEFQG